jgi:hypothetical protein
VTDVQSITYTVLDGNNAPVNPTPLPWAAADVIFDPPRSGDLWPNQPWNLDGQIDAGLIPAGGENYKLVVDIALTGGEHKVHEEVISTRNVPGYEEPEV